MSASPRQGFGQCLFALIIHFPGDKRIKIGRHHRRLVQPDPPLKTFARTMRQHFKNINAFIDRNLANAVARMDWSWSRTCCS